MPELTFLEDPSIEQGDASKRSSTAPRTPTTPSRRRSGEERSHDTAVRRRARARDAIARSTPRRSVALACHVNPDGDALGSMLGLFHVLRAAGRDVVASFPSPFVVAPHYRELPGSRPAHEARRLPGRARRHGHVRLRLARPPRRSRADGRGRARADRPRPSRVEHLLRHDQRDRSRRGRERRGRAPAHRTARAARSTATPRSRSTPRSCATPDASSTTPPRPRCSTSRGSSSSSTCRSRALAPAVRGAPVRVPQAARRGARATPSSTSSDASCGRPSPRTCSSVTT